MTIRDARKLGWDVVRGTSQYSGDMWNRWYVVRPDGSRRAYDHRTRRDGLEWIADYLVLSEVRP